MLMGGVHVLGGRCKRFKLLEGSWNENSVAIMPLNA